MRRPDPGRHAGVLRGIGLVIAGVQGFRVVAAVVAGALELHEDLQDPTSIEETGGHVLSFFSFGDSQGVLFALVALVSLTLGCLFAGRADRVGRRSLAAGLVVTAATSLGSLGFGVGYAMQEWDVPYRAAHLLQTSAIEGAYFVGLAVACVLAARWVLAGGADAEPVGADVGGGDAGGADAGSADAVVGAGAAAGAAAGLVPSGRRPSLRSEPADRAALRDQWAPDAP